MDVVDADLADNQVAIQICRADFVDDARIANAGGKKCVVSGGTADGNHVRGCDRDRIMLPPTAGREHYRR